jgi:predicted membrane channel-forming protein YqfA (hemolysin III family)
MFQDGQSLFSYFLPQFASYVAQVSISFTQCQEVKNILILESYQIFSRLDYAGINVLISGSSFPALYYGMYCNFSLVVFYLIFICALGLTLFIVTLF